MTYYDDLTKDKKRVSIFKKAITQYAHGLTYDLGTGSGILAIIASEYADKVYAYEINPLVIKHYTKANIQQYNNITLIEADASTHEFKEKPDVIICEMLDTALIDEEQATVINNIQKYTKKDTIYIPHSTYDTIILGKSNITNITYQENNQPQFEEYTEEIQYNETIFTQKINTNFEKEIEITSQKTGTINSIKITTYTRVTEQLITKPTPMLNPPLIIPINKTKIHKGEKIIIKIKYKMGGGLNTIKTNIQRIK